MKSILLMDFTVNKESNSITIKREFAAGVPMVWNAFTQKELLDQWWAPKPWKAKTKTMDFKEGGQWHYAMVGPEGGEHWALARYGIIQAQKKFTGFDAFADDQGNVNKELPQSKWEVTFTEKGQVTLVQFQITYDDLAQLEASLEMGFKEGITLAMEGLDDLLMTLKK
jgi:uncharacterized protein YndB with AHSA1/START domain